MRTGLKQQRKSHYILIISLFILFGATSSFLVLSSNLRSHSDLPASIGIVDDSEKIEYFKVLTPAKTLTPDLSETVNISKNTPIVKLSDTIFNNNPALLIYMMLTMILISIVSGSIPIFSTNSYQLIKDYNLNWKLVTLVSMFSLFIVAFGFILNTRVIGLYMPRFFIDDLNILFHNGWVADYVVITVIGFQTPILISMFLSGPAADKVKITSFSKSAVEKAVKKLESLERSLRGGLQVMTVLVVISIFTSEAFRLATINEVYIVGLDILPSEIDYLYGLSFSFTLALVYIPSHIYLNAKRKELMEYTEEQINEENEVEKSWFEELLHSLRIQKSPIESVKLTLTLIAPIISSILPSHLDM